MGRWTGVCVGLAFAGAAGVVEGQTTDRVVEASLEEIGAAGFVLDGRLDEAAWSEARVFTLDHEVEPGDLGPAPVATECRVAVESDAVYFGCVASDPDPDQIRATYTPRDRIDGHDQMGIMLDPYGDGQRGYLFLVSALGVQMDGLLDERAEQGLDTSWNAVWSSSAERTAQGFAVEARIPLASLRFPPPNAGQRPWGVYFMRGYPRSRAVWTYSFARDRNNTCEVCQAPRFEDFLGLRPGRSIDLLPYSSVGLGQTVADDGRLGDVSDEVQIGGDVRWGITPGLSLNVTANPDFSQIEADVAQAEANERFALFYPERRPFFLEGAELFTTPMQTFYSRSIADPEVGAKLSGAVGGSTVGVLAARDRFTSLLLPGVEGSTLAELDRPATAVAARVSRPVSSRATLGASTTYRGADDYHNTTAGLDLLVRPIPQLWVRAQATHAWTDDPETIEAQTGRASSFSDDAFAVISRLELPNVEAWFEARTIGSDFRADLGFLPQVGYRYAEGWGRILERGSAGSWFTRLDVTAGLTRIETEAGDLLQRQWFGRVHYEGPMESRLTLNPRNIVEQFGGGRFKFNQLWIFSNLQATSNLRLEFIGNRGGVVDIASVQEARRWQARPVVRLRLGSHLTTELQGDLQWIDDLQGRSLLDERLLRLRAEYAIDERFAVRAVFQYRDTERGGQDVRNEALFSEFLFTYQRDALSALYIGWAEDRTRMQLHESDTLIDALRPRARRFFLKWSQLVRP